MTVCSMYGQDQGEIRRRDIGDGGLGVGVQVGRGQNLALRGQGPVGALEVERGQAELLEVVHALRAAGRLACRLHGGQEQRDQDRDDRDHDQQFDQCETGLSLRVCLD